MSVHKGGGGVKEIVHVDLISPLEYFFPLMIFQKNNLDHKYPKNCEQKQFFLIIYRKKCFIKNVKKGGRGIRFYTIIERVQSESRGKSPGKK